MRRALRGAPTRAVLAGFLLLAGAAVQAGEVPCKPSLTSPFDDAFFLSPRLVVISGFYDLDEPSILHFEGMVPFRAAMDAPIVTIDGNIIIATQSGTADKNDPTPTCHVEEVALPKLKRPQADWEMSWTQSVTFSDGTTWTDAPGTPGRSHNDVYQPSIEITPTLATSADPVVITVSGHAPNPDTLRGATASIDGNTVFVTVDLWDNPAALFGSYRTTVPVGSLPAGTYDVRVTIRIFVGVELASSYYHARAPLTVYSVPRRRIARH